MRRVFPLILLAITPLRLSAQAGDQSMPKCTDLVKLPECSTERVNRKACRITVERSYPVGLPTIQMKPGTKATVCVANPLSYESLTLDPATATAVTGTDQIAGFFGSATMADLGKIVIRNDALIGAKLAAARVPKRPPQLDDLQSMLDQAHCVINTTLHQTASVYSQIQQALAPPLPLPKTQPWSDYKTWRDEVLIELTGKPGDPDPSPGLQKWLKCDQSAPLMRVLPTFRFQQTR